MTDAVNCFPHLISFVSLAAAVSDGGSHERGFPVTIAGTLHDAFPTACGGGWVVPALVPTIGRPFPAR
jgi:hypothetical protein